MDSIPFVAESEIEKDVVYYIQELVSNINLVFYTIGTFFGIMAVLFTIFYGLYVVLWILDYNEILETNPVHDVYSLLASWLRSVE
mmetsp:Transcript_6139/g.9862  ORF Transcript_6139/g.9862 Transcript_6139/m.9862 type:complete len:85 (+) Transcript_6139:29-283(+)